MEEKIGKYRDETFQGEIAEAARMADTPIGPSIFRRRLQLQRARMCRRSISPCFGTYTVIYLRASWIYMTH